MEQKKYPGGDRDLACCLWTFAAKRASGSAPCGEVQFPQDDLESLYSEVTEAAWTRGRPAKLAGDWKNMVADGKPEPHLE